MNLISFKKEDLPLKELEALGLASCGQMLVTLDDLKALLSGRRTSLLQMKDLQGEGIQISKLNAKISLKRNNKGTADLLIHPVYHYPQRPDFLGQEEAMQMETGEVEHVLKTTTYPQGEKKELLVEYDSETREFMVSDTEKIMVPDMVNNELLNASQKDKYRKGKEVELADGTKFNYSGTDLYGIRSNRLALVASILIDGGLSYMVYSGLHALFGKLHDPVEAKRQSPGYHQAISNIENERPVIDNGHIRFDAHSRSTR
jgi:hypothetical protein